MKLPFSVARQVKVLPEQQYMMQPPKASPGVSPFLNELQDRLAQKKEARRGLEQPRAGYFSLEGKAPTDGSSTSSAQKNGQTHDAALAQGAPVCPAPKTPPPSNPLLPKFPCLHIPPGPQG